MSAEPLVAQPASTAQRAVAPDQLRRRLDPATFTFRTTAEVPPLQEIIGQPRAIDAIAFGLDIGAFGYNLFVAGIPGSGRESAIRSYLEQVAPARPPAPDWVYVHNFDAPDRPRTIRLLAGQGSVFARAMDEFVATAQRAIGRAFEGEEYERRRRDALAGISQQLQALLKQLQTFAAERDFALEITSTGFLTVPSRDGHRLSDEEFEQLPAEQKQEFQRRAEEIEQAVGAMLGQIRELDKAAEERKRQLDHDVAAYTVGPLLGELRDHYRDHPDVLAYLDQVQRDVPEHLTDFRSASATETEEPGLIDQLLEREPSESLARYRVNVLVDQRQTHGAPIVVERNPTCYNLVGRVEYRATFGAMVTDFQHITPGALHRANGGFLILHALDVLTAPFAWEALKRALMNREVRIENLEEQYAAQPTATIRPEPIPLDVKVILIGPTLLYRLLYQGDPDFQELFKVKADFAPEMTWTDAHLQHYAAFISRCVRDGGLKHFNRAAVARVIEEGARRCEDQRKLSARLRDIADLVTEASFWARRAGHADVQAADVDQAIAKQEYRANLSEERVRELIGDGTILIDTCGARVGQINGVTIADLGDYAFGLPVRITARVALGHGTVQSIEREVKLSGPIHAKGMLTLAGYLAAQYAQDWPLALQATVTFEQSYDEVEGDSAAAAELYALLSALADLPLQQGIAVTGSVNQHGEVQAVGGVTRKIEGFFAVCQARGLDGAQGVMIPAANVPHLMLDEAVAEAVRAGMFHVWAIRTIEEGLELLTGRPAGERGDDGQYPAGSVHRLVADRLRHYAEQLRSFAAAPAQALDTSADAHGRILR
jgi:lon-related putative ATP-dependent protease